MNAAQADRKDMKVWRTSDKRQDKARRRRTGECRVCGVHAESKRMNYDWLYVGLKALA